MDKQLEMVIKIIEEKNKDNSNSCEVNDLMKLKQLLAQINGILDDNNFVLTHENIEEIRTELKRLIIKSVAILA